MKILRQFEFDTHVEVVLFGFDNGIASLVENNLNQLSGLQSLKRGLQYSQEKLIFRVTSSPLLENSDPQDFKNSTSAEESFISQLELYHLKSATKTTLFVLNIMTNEAPFNTFPSAFISQSGFAFINLNKLDDLSFVSSTDEEYLSTKYLLSPFLLKNKVISQLSILIYRSLEQLVPEVRPVTSMVPRFVHTRVFFLCGFPLRKCIPEVQLTTLLEFLSHSLGPYLHFEYSVSVISITDSVALTHALLTSFAKYSSTWNHNKRISSTEAKLSVFSPAKLIDLLLQSDEISLLLGKDSSSIPKNGKVIPIFSLLLPEDFDVLLAPSLTNSLDSWYDSPLLSAPSNSDAILLLHPSHDEHARQSPKHLIQYGTNVWSRSNTTMKRVFGFENRDILDKILEIAWQIPQSTVSFSPPSRQFIEDYLWFGANRHSVGTFRDIRAIYRQLIVQATEQLLTRASASLLFYESTHPESDIFETNPLLLNKFGDVLQDFDRIASDFSHLEYDMALKELDRVEVKFSEMEEIFSTISIDGKIRPYLKCQTFETEDRTDLVTFPLNSFFRISSLFVGLVFGFLIVATFFQNYSREAKRGIRRVIR